MEEEPRSAGFYKYDGGNQNMLFLRYASEWFVIFDNGEMNPCEWAYIEQALSVWKLVRV